jgi:hypothetical protein
MQDPILRVNYEDGSWQEIDLSTVLRVFYMASERQHVVHMRALMLRLDNSAQAEEVLKAWRNYKNQLQSILTPYEAVMN